MALFEPELQQQPQQPSSLTSRVNVFLKCMPTKPIIRFAPNVVTPPPIFGALFDELWVEVFSYGTSKDLAQLQFASKWGFNLYWNTRNDFSFSQSCKPDMIDHSLQKANPSQVLVLSVAGCTVDHFQISRICALDFWRLRKLNLEETSITNESLALVSKTFVNLRALNIGSCDQLTDSGIETLSNLTRLGTENMNKTLMMDRCRHLTDECLMSIGKLKQLQFLSMTLSPKSLLQLDHGDGIEVHREGLAQLRSLVGDCHVSYLSGLTNLTYLDFGPYMSLTRASVVALQPLTKLEYLGIRQGQLLDPESIHLLGNLKSLRGLALEKAHFTNSVRDLTTLTNLTMLSLKAATLVDNDLSYIATLPNLTDVDISSCHRITYGGLLYFQELLECQEDHGEGHVCSSSPIQVIRMKDCTGIKAGGFLAVEIRSRRRKQNGQIIAWDNFIPQ